MARKSSEVSIRFSAEGRDIQRALKSLGDDGKKPLRHLETGVEDANKKLGKRNQYFERMKSLKTGGGFKAGLGGLAVVVKYFKSVTSRGERATESIRE